jgi:polyhydroxybutyrate depolymerase
MRAPPRTGLAALLSLAAAGTAACGHARPLAGTSERQLVVGGVTRTYLLHASGTAARSGRPLVFVLHGWHGTAAGIERRTKGTFDRLADRDGAVVVYPQALGDPRWNDGWGEPSPAAPDDLAFLSAVIDALATELAVDRRRVFATGFSNGAAMVYRLACQRPDLVAAVAPVSGSMPAPIASTCQQGAPVSLIVMQGTGDPIVPFGDWLHNDVTTWTRRDGCPAPPTSSQLPDADPTDGTETRVERFAACAAGTEVALYTIGGGGHQWPGGESIGVLKRGGNVPRDFDAGEVIWDFFQKHPRR